VWCRFWYETSEASVRFTESQLAEIRKATLAKVGTCLNLKLKENLTRIFTFRYFP
jgi:hypothetical protein